MFMYLYNTVESKRSDLPTGREIWNCEGAWLVSGHKDTTSDITKPLSGTTIGRDNSWACISKLIVGRVMQDAFGKSTPESLSNAFPIFWTSVRNLRVVYAVNMIKN